MQSIFYSLLSYPYYRMRRDLLSADETAADRYQDFAG